MAEGLILLAALAVDLLCRFAPARLPYIFPFIFNAPVFLGVWLCVLWYIKGMRRLPVAARPHRLRRVLFLLGLAAIYFVLQTHFEYMAQHMFFLNRVQAVALGMFGPFFIAVGWMGGVLRLGAPTWVGQIAGSAWVRRPLRGLSHPLVAAALLLLCTDIWLIPAVHFTAMLDPLLYAVMNLSCLSAGLLFWHVALDPRAKPPARFSHIIRGGTGFLVMFPQIAVSATIALSNRELYSFYSLCGRLYPGISPQYDQLLGGLIQWIPPGMMSTAALLLALNALRITEAKADKEMVIPPGAKVYEAKWTGR